MPDIELRIDSLTDKGVKKWYIFDNLAAYIWPDDFSKSNHEFEQLVVNKLEEKGAVKQTGWCNYIIPGVGLISFDSESGMFECHSKNYFAVEYMKEFLENLLKEGECKEQ